MIIKRNKKILIGSIRKASRSIGLLARIGAITTRTKIISQTEWFDPHLEKGFFDSNGKFDERIKAVKNKSGVYIIKEGTQIIYVGKSYTNNLYKTLTRHFQQWNSSQLVNTYDPYQHNYKVKIIVSNKRNVSDLECEMFKKYKPRDNFQNPCIDDDVPF